MEAHLSNRIDETFDRTDGRSGARGRIVIALSLGLLVTLMLVSRNVPARGSLPQIDPVKRGEYLVTISGCNDCHTPFILGPEGPAPDMSRRLSGHPESLQMPEPPLSQGGPWVWVGAASNTAFAGPWGISYATNLTPDENTGIGVWTEEIFVGALRSGRHWGTSRPILPPMPWQGYARMTDEDLESVYAYLRTIPPISNRVPDAQPAQH